MVSGIEHSGIYNLPLAVAYRNKKKSLETLDFQGFCLVRHQGLEPGTP